MCGPAGAQMFFELLPTPSGVGSIIPRLRRWIVESRASGARNRWDCPKTPRLILRIFRTFRRSRGAVALHKAYGAQTLVSAHAFSKFWQLQIMAILAILL